MEVAEVNSVASSRRRLAGLETGDTGRLGSLRYDIVFVRRSFILRTA